MINPVFRALMLFDALLT